MLKKYDKVDLRSDNYKARKTPEKKHTESLMAPLSNSPAYQSRQASERIDPNDLFQKVCCPNCRFIFKIIKNAQPVMQHSISKKSITHNALVQTEQMMAKDLRNLSKMSYEISKKETPTHSQSSIFKTGLIKHNNISKSQIIKQPDHLQSSTYRFPDYSPSKSPVIRRINYLNMTKKSEEAESQQSKQAFMSVAQPEPTAKSPMIPQVSLEQQSRTIQNRVRQQIRRQLQQLPELVSSELRNRKTIESLISFYTELPVSTEIPSYCKMLISDYEMERSSNKKSIKFN